MPPSPRGAHPRSDDPRHRSGARAEAWAEDLLRRRGCRILARNHRCRSGEVDLVVCDGDVLAFVEVRARRRGAPVTGETSITRRKRRRLARAALDWLSRRGRGGLWDRPMRFDLVAVVLDGRGRPVDGRHHRGAFEPPGGLL